MYVNFKVPGYHSCIHIVNLFQCSGFCRRLVKFCFKSKYNIYLHGIFMLHRGVKAVYLVYILSLFSLNCEIQGVTREILVNGSVLFP